jgi:hypothetical protein
LLDPRFSPVEIASGTLDLKKRQDHQAPAERLMNRARPPLMDDRPETQKDIRLASPFIRHVPALALPVGVVVLDL